MRLPGAPRGLGIVERDKARQCNKKGESSGANRNPVGPKEARDIDCADKFRSIQHIHILSIEDTTRRLHSGTDRNLELFCRITSLEELTFEGCKWITEGPWLPRNSPTPLRDLHRRFNRSGTSCNVCLCFR